MLQLKIDHITIASSSLTTMEQQLQALGLTTTYGGKHSNGITHMSLASFLDGSYIELISKIALDQVSPWWNQAIDQDAGICAWAVETDDVATECQRLSSLGVPVQGPKYMHRQTPSGQQAEWDLAFIGAQEPGAKLPFIIKDRSAREIRVPRAHVAESELTGISRIILGVQDLPNSVETFCQLYQLARPQIVTENHLAAELAVFTDAPLILASASLPGQLAQRLTALGDTPWGLLIGTNDIPFTEARLCSSVCVHSKIGDKAVIWLKPHTLTGTQIGFIST